MFDNVHEANIKGSDRLLLQVSEHDYLFNYNHVSINNSQDFANNYFSVRSRDGIPFVEQTSIDKDRGLVSIFINVDYDVNRQRDNYTVPDTIPNINLSAPESSFE